ncbi:TPA: hypothetical protein ACLX67_001455, partial [Streptococcus pneumoniae]
TPKVRFFLSNFWGAVHSTPDTMRFSYLKDFLLNLFIFNENQTRKLAAGCSKQCFEVADGSRRGLKRFSKSIT